jgi:hypothetical protein
VKTAGHFFISRGLDELLRGFATDNFGGIYRFCSNGCCRNG